MTLSLMPRKLTTKGKVEFGLVFVAVALTLLCLEGTEYLFRASETAVQATPAGDEFPDDFDGIQDFNLLQVSAGLGSRSTGANSNNLLEACAIGVLVPVFLTFSSKAKSKGTKT